MAVNVIGLLKSVEIEHENCMRFGRGWDLLQGRPQGLVKLAAVGQARQRILQGEDKDFLLGRDPSRVFPFVLAGPSPSVRQGGKHGERRQNEKLCLLYTS